MMDKNPHLAPPNMRPKEEEELSQISDCVTICSPQTDSSVLPVPGMKVIEEQSRQAFNREQKRSIQKGVKNIIYDLQMQNQKAAIQDFSSFKKPRARKSPKK